MDEFFNQLQSDMRRPDVSQEAITAAFNAIQQMDLEPDSEEAASAVAESETPGISCSGCGVSNPAENSFCATCGASLRGPSARPMAPPSEAAPAAGLHHYHHHYHHHYFAPGQAAMPSGMAAVPAARPAVAPAREPGRLRAPAGATGLSRAEAAVRRMSQDWAQACNTKQLDDLVELYLADALVLRPNIPPVRGAAAIREFLFAVLDAGLGDVEMEPLRVELFADFAYEAGRCKMLVPVAMGKRREERGKYVILFARQPAGEWKIMLDSWSSDLSLAAGGEPAAAVPSIAPARAPRR